MKKQLKTSACFPDSDKRVRILGVGIDPISPKQLRHIFRQFLKDRQQHFLATVNPEFIIEAQINKNFREILSFCDLNVADGIGILWASRYLNLRIDDSWVRSRAKKLYFRKFLALWQAFYSLLAIVFYPRFLKTRIPRRITGTDVANTLVKLTQSGNHTVYLLGGQKGATTAAKLALEKKYPKALIVGSRTGFLKKGQTEKSFRKSVNKAKPDILLVALGSPRQEYWIFKNMDKMPSVKIAVGIGGALDFLAKTKKRAPAFMQKTGLEWLFRLYQEPWRL
ncbi:WecB/TagA/CpsF family glycosyltransferase, partial [Patescibacteria group bacterium]|nr:WecB/TagA/CpsF family glycosyltransferase [Patescibacteria group bacterium]